MLRLKRELGSVSAQDQFSRWAKLRREHDKAVAELEKCCMSLLPPLLSFFSSLCVGYVSLTLHTASALSTSRTRFDRSTNIARLACTTGLRFFLQFWFAKRPLFWLPEGLFPGWLEWCLALPRAPKGSISLHVWGMACSASIQYVQSMLDVGFQTVSTEKVTEGRPKENGSGMSSRMEMERGKEWEKEKTHAFDSSGRLREESNKEL